MASAASWSMKPCGGERAECTRRRASRWHTIPKASAKSVARAIFDGVENGDEDIFPDPMSQAMAGRWRTGVVKDFERQNAALVA